MCVSIYLPIYCCLLFVCLSKTSDFIYVSVYRTRLTTEVVAARKMKRDFVREEGYKNVSNKPLINLQFYVIASLVTPFAITYIWTFLFRNHQSVIAGALIIKMFIFISAHNSGKLRTLHVYRIHPVEPTWRFSRH